MIKIVVEVIRNLIDKLDANIEEQNLGKPFFSDPRYKPFTFSKENFMPINSVDSNRIFVFVDGGNQEVIGAPNFSVQINRVYFSVFKGQERILNNSLPNRIEFFSAVHSCFRTNEIFYDTSIIPLDSKFENLLPDEKDLSFNSFDRSVMVGIQRANASRVASVARKFAEWEYCFHLIQNQMEEGDVLVIDGSLQTGYTNEFKYAKRVYDAAVSKDVIVTGLSKSSRLFTTKGLSLLGAISQFAVESEIQYDSWYFPIAEATSTDHNAFILAVKLGETTDHVFRYEIYREQYKNMNENTVNDILSQLAKNAIDLSFPGYPYGLIDADRFARVTNDDVESYRSILLSEISKRGEWKKFARHIQTTNAHSILNMLMR